MRLIDADKLIERMYHDAFETDTDMQKWDSGCWIRYKMFENAMDSAPTVEERKKGEWIETEFLKLKECSCCHSRWGIYDVENFDFCPDCGADMRGEEK